MPSNTPVILGKLMVRSYVEYKLTNIMISKHKMTPSYGVRGTKCLVKIQLPIQMSGNTKSANDRQLPGNSSNGDAISNKSRLIQFHLTRRRSMLVGIQDFSIDTSDGCTTCADRFFTIATSAAAARVPAGASSLGRKSGSNRRRASVSSAILLP